MNAHEADDLQSESESESMVQDKQSENNERVDQLVGRDDDVGYKLSTQTNVVTSDDNRTAGDACRSDNKSSESYTCVCFSFVHLHPFSCSHSME